MSDLTKGGQGRSASDVESSGFWVGLAILLAMALWMVVWAVTR